MEYEAIIGMEVHLQLKTESKIYCGCAASFGAEPNTQTCPVCLGLPGALPVLNRRAVELGVRAAVALDCEEIAGRAAFARKNYFYPDLPKGYQISQFGQPLACRGKIEIDAEGGPKLVRIRRLLLEEDAGKLIHSEDGLDRARVDFNRCGIPLLEIVTEPDLRTPEEARSYLTALKEIVEYIGASDADMEKGHLRCEPNVSVRARGSPELGIRTELKNLNSFRNVERAIAFEIDRHIGILKRGGSVEQATMLWDERAERARPMRIKEEAHDYRYFPEPDLVFVTTGPELARQMRSELPELPRPRRARFVREYEITGEQAVVCASSRAMADYFEALAGACGDGKEAAKWVAGVIAAAVNDGRWDTDAPPITPERLGALIRFVADGTVSGIAAREKLLPAMAERPDLDVGAAVDEFGLRQLSSEAALRQIIDRVIGANPGEVERYRAGEERLLAYFVGRVMEATEGRANPRLVNELLRGKLRGARRPSFPVDREGSIY
jgi:aspartyl-tRNA(Asn)/glutamyl-tRNA(Gln) amidotransferase subunit B